jgi:hypothetical protein
MRNWTLPLQACERQLRELMTAAAAATAATATIKRKNSQERELQTGLKL